MNSKYLFIIIPLCLLIGIVIFGNKIYDAFDNQQNECKLKITQACEDGCVMSQGLDYNDNPINISKEINDKIFLCIGKCNNKYFFGGEDKEW